MMYKVVIQKLVYGKSKPKESDLLANQRTVIVETETISKGVDHLRRVLDAAGAFADSTGEIVKVIPADDVVTLHP